MKMNDKIKTRRVELNLTLDDVAKIVGVSGATVSRWETGDIENMRRDKIALLATALQVSPAFIMGWDEGATTDTGKSKSPLRSVSRLEEVKPTPDEDKEIASFIDFLVSKRKGQ